MRMRPCLLLAALLLGPGALAQPSTPGNLTALAAQHFPQPIAAGALLHRLVLQPVESQTVLGHVQQIVRQPDGTVDVVVALGGLLGIGARPVAVPLDAMTLLGEYMEIVAYTPKQLDAFPTYHAAGATPVPKATLLAVGLSGPSH